VLRALGVTYLRQEDYAGAILVLERALQLTPNDHGSMLVLGQIYLKQEKRPEALALLQRAKELGASDPELDKMLDQLGREVDTEWSFVQLESRHFRVSFAGTEERSTARFVLGALEEAYDDVGRKLGYSPDQRLTAVLYTAEDFRAITRTPDWVGGVFDGRIKLPVRGLEADDPDLSRVLRHEYAHSVVTLLAGPRCPAWLNEGIAVWAEEAETGDHQRWAEQTLAAHGTLPFDALSDSFARLPVDGAEAAYAQSYLAVQSLVDRYGSRRLVEFLSALSHGTNVSDAFAEVYREGLEGFQERLLRGYSG
jgi:tetratricopeptide (TPR) repeat protein